MPVKRPCLFLRRHAYHSAGIGLIEIMIAMVLGLILVGGVIELFVNSKTTYRTAEELSRMQENARYAMYLIQKDLRMAGYSGCAPSIVNHLNTAGNNYNDTLFRLDEAVGGWEYSAGGGTGPGDSFTITSLDPSGIGVSSWDDRTGSDLPASLQNLVVAGTDVLTIKALGSNQDISVKDNNTINSASINTNSANNIPQYTILLITQDCNDADMFQKRNNASGATVSRGNGSTSNPGPGNVNPNTLPGFGGAQKWSTIYGPGAKFLALQSNAYYVGKGTNGEPALFRMSFETGAAGTPQEIVEGVENIQVLYGVDTDAPEDGIANVYRTIDNVGVGATDGTKVSSVRISLLMRTVNSVSTDVDTKTDYSMTGHTTATATEIDPINDRYLRYVFTSTVKLRNRGDK
ncbi:MAG: PilW family protein [Gammaproteobacteria bacterium]|nr:MAG: PilW family protein [Gammaproteobacteria bacterium]